MKVLISQIVNAETGLNKIANTSLPISQSIKLAKTIKELEVVDSEYNKKRQALVEKYGKEITNEITGEKSIQVTAKNMDVFIKELKAILNTEVELNLIPFDIEGDGIDLKLSPAEILSMEFLLKQNEGE